MLDEYQKMDYKAQSIIDDYHTGYQQLIDTIIENKDDMAKIKAAITEIDASYSRIYNLDYRNLFYILEKQAPLAIFAMLMNSNMRKKYLPVISKDENGTEVSDLTVNNDKAAIFKCISYYITDSINQDGMFKRLPELLGGNLKTFSGATDEYWKDVEQKGKKFMILTMEKGNIIRASGESGGDLDVSGVNGQFVILDGIDYKSNNASHKLLYMEV